MPQKQTNPSTDTPAVEQLKQNQRELGVGSDHKTETMQKGHRGTFP